jgi:subfamily B ATP-binding cassette protein HlyB/CyaB
MQTGPLDQKLKSLLQQHAFFSLLEDDKIEQLIEKFEMTAFSMGETIIREGEPGDCAYLIYSGKVRAFQRSKLGKPITLGMLSAGDLFGERAILEHEPRSASCRAAEDAVLFRIGRQDFQKLLEDHPLLIPYFQRFLQQRAVINFLRVATVLGSVPATEVIALLDQLEECSYPSGAVIVREGEPGDRVYIIKSGEVKVVREQAGAGAGAGAESVLDYLGEGDYFGERALLLEEPRSASVVALSDTACYSLRRQQFQNLLTLAPRLKEQLARGIERYLIREKLADKFGSEPSAVPGPSALIEEQLPPDAQAGEIPRLPEAGPPPLGQPPRPRPWLRFWKRYPWVKQYGETDCGAAVLAMVARYHGIALSVAGLREKANIGREGASMLNLAAAAESIGFDCRAVATEPGQLAGLPLPAVAHWKGYHYLVVYEVNARQVILGDPAVGLISMDRGEFERDWTRRLLLLTPTPRLANNPPAPSVWKILSPLVLPFKHLFLPLILVSLLLSCFPLTIPIATQLVVDHALAWQDPNLLNVVLGGMLLVIVLYLATSFLRQYLFHHVSQKLRLHLAADLFRRLLQLPLHFFLARRTSDVRARFEDNRRLQEMLAGKPLLLLLDCLAVLLGLGLMLYYNASLTLIALVAFLFSVGLTLVLGPRGKHSWQRAVEQGAQVELLLVESLEAIRAIKDATAEALLQRKLERLVRQQTDLERQGRRWDLVTDGLSRTMQLLAATSVLCYGAHLVLDRELTVGQWLAIQMLVAMIGPSALALLELGLDLRRSLRSLEALNDLYEAEPEQSAKLRTVPLPRVRGHITFQDVSFHYHPGEQDVLSHINLVIQPGQTVALVGRPGAGKTTLTLLLQRFYQPTSGTVLVDGVDLAAVEVRSLREQISGVAGETPILSGTVHENIALADPRAPLNRVMEAAKLAQAHDFVLALPQGYETLLGGTGMSLTPDQRQRLGIARAVFKQPQIMILDEATSALDPQTEESILRNVSAFLERPTTLIVTNRWATIQHADVLVVLDEGQLVRVDTQRDLLSEKGLYDYLVAE